MINKEAVEVLEIEFRAIKERLLENICPHLWQLIDWVLDNSYRHVVISEIGCWLDYVKNVEDVECIFRKHPDSDIGNIRTAYRKHPDTLSV